MNTTTICEDCGFDWSTAEDHGMRRYDCPCLVSIRVHVALIDRRLRGEAAPADLRGTAQLIAYANPALYPRPTLERAA